MKSTLPTLATLIALDAASPGLAQLTINGVTDRSTHTETVTFTVETEAGYAYSARLDTDPVPVGVPVTIQRADYYELQAWRTNLSPPFDVTNQLIRFIVQSDRLNPEKGLIKWTPYPVINSAAGEFAGAQLHVTTPHTYPLGLPIPVVAWVRDAQDRERRANGLITAPGFEDIQIRRGAGSGFLPPATVAGPLHYDARLHALTAPKQIIIETNTAWTMVSGVLSGDVTWPDNSRIHIHGNLTVPATGSLTIGAGTIVKLSPLVNITNSGRCVINGTADRPVVFAATNVVYPERNAGAWGGFLLRGTSAQLTANGAILAGGGGAASFSFSPGASHRSEQAVLLIHSGARVALTNCAILNTAGQVGNGYNSDFTVDHTLFQKAIVGGEYVGGTIIFNHAAVIEFPADNGVVDAQIADADYDALYFTTGTHIIQNTLVGFAMDDAIDSGSGGAGSMWVSNCWIEAALHEANAWSGEGRVARTYDTVMLNCGQGFENGWSTGDNSPLCYADRILSTANSVGVRTGDSYDWSYNGYAYVSNSLLLYNYRDVFIKTWNAPGSGWQTNSWVDRLQQTILNDNWLTAADARFPNNAAWNPAADAWRLTPFMGTPPEAPVGIGLALRSHRLTAADLTNGVPVRLSTFTTNFVSVDYAVLGTNGPVTAGSLTFVPGETLKYLPRVWPTANDQVLVVALQNPVRGEVTTLPLAWYLQSAQTNAAQTTLIAQGSRWNYLDTGENAGTAWRALDYPDHTWLNGLAQLGYGDDDEITQVRSNGVSGRIITTYFRQKFLVEDPAAFTDLALWLLRDDGGVVYLNGTEVFRSDSLPPAPFAITYTVLATNYNGGQAPPDNTIDRARLPATLLQSGTNILAVEIHQQSATSSDISFDFSLTGNRASTAAAPVLQQSPTNQAARPGETGTFNVAASGAAPLAYLWYHNQSRLLTSTLGPALTLNNVTLADAGAYHVVVVNPDGSTSSAPAWLLMPGADTDGDGMPDDWEAAQGLNPALDDAALDPDGDGLTNLQEFRSGTDPQDPSSYLQIGSIAAPAGASSPVTLTFAAVAGHNYTVQFADSPCGAAWNTLTNVAVVPTDQVITVVDRLTPPPEQRYYRLVTPAQP